MPAVGRLWPSEDKNDDDGDDNDDDDDDYGNDDDGWCCYSFAENLVRAASVALELVVRAQGLSGGEVPDQDQDQGQQRS